MQAGSRSLQRSQPAPRSPRQERLRLIPEHGLPDDIDPLKAAPPAARADVARVTADFAAALARQSSDQALIAHLEPVRRG